MPLDVRSILPTVPGVPAWGAVLIAVGATFVGFLLDAMRGTELTSAFAVFYFLGCVGAALAVRSRGLFAAAVQPPLILVVGVPLAYQSLTPGTGGGMKDLIFNTALPLVNRFPLMLVTALVVLAITAGRRYLNHQARPQPARAARGTAEPTAAPARPASRPATAPHTQVHAQSGRRTRGGENSTGARRRVAEPQLDSGQFDLTDQFDRDRRLDVEGDRRSHRAASTGGSPREPFRPASAPVPAARLRPEPATRQYARQSEPVGHAAEQYTQPADPDVPVHPLPQVRYRDRHDAP